MTCKYCIEEQDKDGTYTWCPINCEPIRGKWKRRVYEQCFHCEYEGVSTPDMISRIRIDYEEDVHKQNISRAIKSLIEDGLIKEVGGVIAFNKNSAAKWYIATNHADIESSWDGFLLEKSGLEQVLWHCVLSVKSEASKYLGYNRSIPMHRNGWVFFNTKNVPQMIDNLMQYSDEGFDRDTPASTIYEYMEPNVKSMRRIIAKAKKNKIASKGINHYNGLTGFRREAVKALWDDAEQNGKLTDLTKQYLMERESKPWRWDF